MSIHHINHKVHTPQKRTKTGLLLSPPLEKEKKASTLNMTVPARFICKRSDALVGGFNPCSSNWIISPGGVKIKHI